MLNWTLMLHKWEKLGDKMGMLEGTYSATNNMILKKKSKGLIQEIFLPS